MKLHDPSFISFDGAPITGRIPPTVLIANDLQPDALQRAGIAHAYKLFCDAKRVSIPGYLTQHRTLRDGTRIRMMSNNGVDTVVVWPEGGEEESGLVDAFFAEPNYYGGGGFPAWGPKFSGLWKFKGKTTTPTDQTMKPMRKTHEEAPGIAQHPGNLTWWSNACKANGKPMIVSWWGRHSRYGRLQYFGVHQNVALAAIEHQTLYGTVGINSRIAWKDAFKPAIWLQGVKHAVRMTDDPITHALGADVRVMSAGLRKEADGLKLYVTSYQASNKLAVYKGAIRPYSGAAVQVDKVCDIEFTIDSTTYAAANPTNPMWETILQPVYFNGDCTVAASIVAVDKNTTVNTAAAANWPTFDGLNLYFAARLMTVDVVAGTTSFTSEHASYHSEGATTTTTSQADSTTRSYGAVDFDGAQMLIAMVEAVGSRYYTKATTGVLFYPAAGSHSATETLRAYNTGYRVVFVHNGFVLAGRTFTGEVNGTFHVESSIIGGVSSSGTGYRTETASDPMLNTASIEGGDLRHSAVVVAEYLEVGTEDVFVTLTGSFGPDVHYDNYDGQGNPYDASTGTWLAVVDTLVRTTTYRKPAGQMSVWKGGVQFDVTTYVEETTKGGQSVFGWSLQQYNYFPGSTPDPHDLLDFFIPNTAPTDLAGWDYMGAFATGSHGLRTGGSVSGTGRPFATVFASAPDGKAWFYNIGAFFADNTFEHGWASFGIPDLDSKAAFVLADTKHAFDVHDITGTEFGQPSLASAVFLYQTPERFK